MTPERWTQVKRAFAEAAELGEAERRDYLLRACADDPEVRLEVERLLARDPDRTAFIDNPPVAPGVLHRISGAVRSLRPGETLAGRFRVVRQVGAGGMGEVYEAEDLKLGGRVAIKTIRPDIAGDKRMIDRFQREIQLSRQVTHPNVCRVHDIVSAEREDGGQVDFLTMEFVDGETLADLLRQRAPLSLDAALPLLEQVCSALDAAHAAGVLHRDLKSSNVLIGRNATGSPRAVVTDFGLARTIDGASAGASRSGWGAGTPAYMAPEQLEGGPLSARTDLYALGVVMYEMATGRQPFAGESPLQVAVQRIKHRPPRPSESNASVDRRWESAILRCLAYDPAERPASGAEIVEALRGRRTVSLPSFRLPRVKSRWGLAAAGACAIAAAAWYFRHDLFAKPLSAEAARWYGEGVNAISDGTYHKATKALERTLALEPDFAAGRCRLAEAYQELDYRDRAREELVKAIDARPGVRTDRLLCDATKWYLVGDWDKALGALRTRADRAGAGEKSGAMLDVARLLERAGRTDRAAEAYQAVVAADSSQPGARVRLAILLADRNQGDRARKLLDEADASYRTLGNLEGQGEVLLARALTESNMVAIEELAAKAEKFGEQAASEALRIRAKLRRAQALDARGKPEDSRRETEAAIELAQSSGMGSIAANGLIDLGRALFAHRKYEEAERRLEQALKIAGRYGNKMTEARTKVLLADLLGRTERPERAFGLLNEIREFSDSTGARTLVFRATQTEGDVHWIRRDHAKAKAAYLRAAGLGVTDSERAGVEERLADLALLAGAWSEADSRLSKAIEMRTGLGDKVREQYDRLRRAYALGRKGDFDGGMRELKRVSDDGPANDGVRRTWEMDQASFDFQMLRFEESLRRLENLRQEAERAGLKALLNDVKANLCVKYAEAGRTERADPYCREMASLYEDRPATLMDLTGALAQIEAARGRFETALRHARTAINHAQTAKLRQDEWLWTLVLTQILHRALNPEWKAARDRATALLGDIERDIGAAELSAFLKRPVTAGRWRQVRSLR